MTNISISQAASNQVGKLQHKNRRVYRYVLGLECYFTDQSNRISQRVFEFETSLPKRASQGYVHDWHSKCIRVAIDSIHQAGGLILLDKVQYNYIVDPDGKKQNGNEYCPTIHFNRNKASCGYTWDLDRVDHISLPFDKC